MRRVQSSLGSPIGDTNRAKGMSAKSFLHPLYSKLRPIYLPIVTRDIYVAAGEKLVRFGLSRGMKKGPLILLACMPKSGSTFVARLLDKATGFPVRRVMSSGENPDIDLNAVRMLSGLGTVTQTHFICTGKFVDAANSYDIRTLILERNLLDVVISYVEYMSSEDMKKSYRDRGFVSAAQNLVVDDSFDKLPQERQYDLMIDLALPWYLRFHVAWRRYEQTMHRRPLWLDYDEFFSDIPGQSARIFEYCGIDAPAVAAPPATATKFNVGRGGRGRELLSKDHIAKIEKLIGYYPQYADELIKW
jgi:hypothetical protein